jgi:hypothetical protein
MACVFVRTAPLAGLMMVTVEQVGFDLGDVLRMAHRGTPDTRGYRRRSEDP